MNTLLKILSLSLLFCAGSVLSQTSTSAITADELSAHVKYLASDELEGRGSGTEGNRKAAAYLVDEMKKYGLQPAGDNGTYYQEFEFNSSVELGSGNKLVFMSEDTLTLQPDEEFRPLSFSSNETVDGTLAFLGYGVSAPDKDYDDYEGIDVTGKIVLVLRYGPDGNDPHSDFYRYTAFRNKARTARDKGAKGLIIVSGPEDSDELVKLAVDNSFASSGIPVVSMRLAPVINLFHNAGLDLEKIQNDINTTKKPGSFELPAVHIKMVTDVNYIKSKTSNVLGYLAGNDAGVKDQVLVVGAHFDHLGYGGPGSGSLQPDVHAIHNGADDNASGTAALLELAQAFAAHKSMLDRTLLFIGFSGEELGTLGSAYYVEHPFFPLDNTIAMINMDEVGRLRENKLTVYGTGTSPSWPSLLHAENMNKEVPADTFHLEKIPDGFGPSDHAQFYSKNIPVLFFFTGTHEDYHKPSDDWDKINYQGEEKIAQYIYTVARDIEAEDERPTFAKAGSSSPMGGDGRGFTVTLGIIPDYTSSNEGMKIGGIRPDGPAEKAGLKSGDVIVKMAGKQILNIYDYMAVLGDLKDGDVVDVEVMREGKPVKVSATMKKRG